MTAEFKRIQTKLLINNQWVNGSSGKTFPTFNPATGEKIADLQEAGKQDVDKAVDAAKKAFETWGKSDGSYRSKLLYKLADLIEKNMEELAKLESLDSGKPYKTHSLSVDLPSTVQCYRYYAGWADKIEGKSIPVDGNYVSFTRHEPVGVVAQIIPWNFPILMQAWKFGPALATGCTVILKPSKETPLTALRVGELVVEAGFPPGVVNILSGAGAELGETLVKHPQIDKVAFTGSTDVGKKIQLWAAETNLKKVSLELGGKGPHVVFADANLEKAVDNTLHAIFFNMGQCCAAGSRVYVEDSVYDQFVQMAVEKAKKRKVGDPFKDDTLHGPQATKKQFEKILEYIKCGKKEGATLACGGNRLGEKGYFIEPTIFIDVKDDMKICKDEIFGPVLCVLRFKELDEVIKRANDSIYGLTGGVSTNDINKAMYVANNIRAGTIWINCWNVLDVAQPFGGYKQSGIGRELGCYGLFNYIEVKTVMTKLDICEGKPYAK